MGEPDDSGTGRCIGTLNGVARWIGQELAVSGEVADPNGAGHTYFAAMESDGGQAPTFFDGETSSINTFWAAVERLFRPARPCSDGDRLV